MAKKTTKKVSLAQIKPVIEELNKVFDLDPQLPTKGKLPALTAAIKEFVCDPDDGLDDNDIAGLSNEALNVLTSLGFIEAPESKEEVVEEEAPAKEKKKSAGKGKKAAGTKKEKAPSAFGTATDILCTNPDMKTDELHKALSKKGFDPKGEHKTAVNTALSSVRRIVSSLRANKLMK